MVLGISPLKIFISIYLFALLSEKVVSVDLSTVTVSYDPLAINWFALSFDSKNFLCENYAKICINYLDQINCDASSRIIATCDDGTLKTYHGNYFLSRIFTS